MHRKAPVDYRQYAKAHQLDFEPEAVPEPLTPLLAKGDVRWFRPVLRGRLVPWAEGLLAPYGYQRTDGPVFDYTVLVTEIPESAAFVPRLLCERRGRVTDNVQHGFEERSTRLWQESIALAERYRVLIGPYQDENWMRQLFSPRFIEWLATKPAPTFSFELTYGTLCASIEETDLAEEELDRFRDCASQVAHRIREEASER